MLLQNKGLIFALQSWELHFNHGFVTIFILSAKSPRKGFPELVSYAVLVFPPAFTNSSSCWYLAGIWDQVCSSLSQKVSQDNKTAKLALSVQESTGFPTGALSQWRHHRNTGSQWSPQLEVLRALTYTILYMNGSVSSYLDHKWCWLFCASVVNGMLELYMPALALFPWWLRSK